MPEIVINKCYGGFGLSPKAELRLYELGYTDGANPVTAYFSSDRGKDNPFGLFSCLNKWRAYLESGRNELRAFLTVFSPDEQFVLYSIDIKRDNPLLLQVVKDLGEEANGACAELSICSVPDGVDRIVEEYDGREWISEQHRTWG